MAFEHILASVRLQENKDPTIYMALCMTESLFRDIEDKAGEYLCDCDIGSERMANKLLWLCDQIQDIYRQKVNDFPWDQELEETLNDLAATGEKLRSVERAAEDLSAKRRKLSDLQGQLREAQRAYQEYKRVEEACQELKNEIESLRRINAPDLERMKEQMVLLEAQRDKIRNECQTFRRDRIEPLEATVEELSRKLEAERNQESLLIARKGHLEADAAQQLQTVQALTQEVTSLEEKNQDLKAQIQSLEAVLEQSKSDRATLVANVEGLTGENRRLREEEIGPLTATVSSLEGEKKELQDTLDQLQTGKNQLEEEAVQLHQTVQTETREVGTLEEKNQGLKAQIQSLEAALEQSKSDYAALVANAEGLTEENRNLREDMIGPLTATVAGLEGERKELQDTLDRLEAEKNDLEGKKQALPESINACEEQCRQIRQTIQELEDKLEAVTERTRTLEELKAQQQDNYSEQQTKEAALQEECETYRKQYLEPVETRIVALEDERKRKDDILKEKQEREMILNDRIRGIVEDIEKANATIRMYEKEIPQKQSALANSNEDMAQKEAELQRLRTEYEELTTRLQEIITDIDHLKYTKIPEYRANLQDDEREYGDLTNQAEALSKELVSQREITKSKEAQRDQLRSEYDELEERCRKADAEIGRLTELRNDLQSKTSDEQVAQYKATLQEHTEHLEKLLQEAGALQTEIQRLQTEQSHGEEQCRVLEARRADWIKMEADTKRKQTELQPFGTESFMKQYQAQREQLDRLEKACTGLRGAQNLLDTYLGRTEQSGVTPDGIKMQIQSLKQAVDRICTALVNLADNLKWEGRS